MSASFASRPVSVGRSARHAWLPLFFLTALFAGEALACPDCVTSRAVRTWLFDDASWRYLGLLLLPLVVLSGVTAMLYRIGAPRTALDVGDEGLS